MSTHTGTPKKRRRKMLTGHTQGVYKEATGRPSYVWHKREGDRIGRIIGFTKDGRAILQKKGKRPARKPKEKK